MKNSMAIFMAFSNAFLLANVAYLAIALGASFLQIMIPTVLMGAFFFFLIKRK